MNLVIRQSTKFFLAVIGIFLVGCFPAFFQGLRISFPNYLNQMGYVITQLLCPERMEYAYEGKSYFLFPDILSPYFYSLQIFFGAFFLALLVSTVGIFITFYLPRWLRKIVAAMSFIGESTPDIFIIVVFQLIVLWFYQKTGVLVMNIAQASNTHIILMPILCLFILPTCFLYHMMVLAVKEELEMDYVDVAKSKGLNSHQILFRHILRNIMASLATYSKTLIWMLLSNLVITEFMFDINGGLTMFIYHHPTPLVFTVSLFLIFIPLFLLYVIVSALIQKLTGKGVVI